VRAAPQQRARALGGRRGGLRPLRLERAQALLLRRDLAPQRALPLEPRRLSRLPARQGCAHSQARERHNEQRRPSAARPAKMERSRPAQAPAGARRFGPAFSARTRTGTITQDQHTLRTGLSPATGGPGHSEHGAGPPALPHAGAAGPARAWNSARRSARPAAAAASRSSAAASAAESPRSVAARAAAAASAASRRAAAAAAAASRRAASASASAAYTCARPRQVVARRGPQP